MRSDDPGPIRRLHPASLLFSLGSAARRLLVPGIVVLFASRGSNMEIWFMLLFVPAALAALARYVSYRYGLCAGEIVVREGIVTRNERHVPYARIQNINLVQNPLHRMLRVAEVHLETASGDKPEAVIRVLSLAAIEQLRAHVFRGRGAETDGRELDPPRTLLQLDPGELVLLGLLSNRGTALVAAAMGLAWQLDLDLEQRIEALPQVFAEYAPAFSQPGTVASVLVGLAVLVSLLLVMRALSVIWSVLKFGGFRLTRRDDDLRARYGLLTQISATIPRHRVQLLSTGSRPLERLCGRASVQVETAGGRSGGGEQDGAAVDHLWLAPLVRRQQVGVLLNEVFPEVPFDALDWQPLAPRARRRILVRGSAAALLVAGVAVAAVGPWGAVVAAVALPWAWIHARLWVRHTAWALTETAVVYRSGWWHRRLSVVRFNKVQALELRRSPFDRRHGMASVQVDTAGAGRSGHRIDIVYVALSAARAIVADISAAASRTAFRW